MKLSGKNLGVVEGYGGEIGNMEGIGLDKEGSPPSPKFVFTGELVEHLASLSWIRDSYVC